MKRPPGALAWSRLVVVVASIALMPFTVWALIGFALGMTLLDVGLERMFRD